MIILALVFLYGLLIGSFLNAWIWRTHTNRQISKGRSICPHCKHTLAWHDLIPLFSWLWLKGKCRYCKKKISVQYPLVELATALLWVGLAVAIHPVGLYGYIELGVWFAISALLIASFVYDAKWMLLPDQFTIPAIIIAAGWLATRWLVFGQSGLAMQQLIGATLFGGVFFLLWFGSRGKWLGDGDIRLAVLMGLILTPSQLIMAIFLSFNLGAIVGLILLARHKAKRGSAIAFGPFLIIGTFLGFFWGQYIVDAYLKLLI